jgi:hypothetical protein
MLLSKGWGVHESNVRMLTDSGVTREQAVLTLTAHYRSLQSAWLLCLECVAQAEIITLNRLGDT